MTHRFEIPELYVTEERVEQPYGYDRVSTRMYPDGTCETEITSYYTTIASCKIVSNTSGTWIGEVTKRTGARLEWHPPSVERSQWWQRVKELTTPIEQEREYPSSILGLISEPPPADCKYLSNSSLLRCAVHPERKDCEGCVDFECEK